MCTVCSTAVFPFNHYDEESDYLQALSEYWDKSYDISIQRLQEKVFVPFEINFNEMNLRYNYLALTY